MNLEVERFEGEIRELRKKARQLENALQYLQMVVDFKKNDFAKAIPYDGIDEFLKDVKLSREMM